MLTIFILLTLFYSDDENELFLSAYDQSELTQISVIPDQSTSSPLQLNAPAPSKYLPAAKLEFSPIRAEKSKIPVRKTTRCNAGQPPKRYGQISPKTENDKKC